MNKRSDKLMLYAPSEYDNNFVLKLNLSAWLIIAFIMRPFIIFIASVSNRKDRFSLLNIVYSDHTWALISAAASIPTIILMVAWIKRTPHAGPYIRHTWHKGRELLTISLLFNAGTIITPWLLGARLHDIAVVQISICGILLYLLWRSPRIRDTFADFPHDTTATTSEPSRP